ncbi:glycosyltransferase [Thaumasiovibrio sp. DFM-14]|uniref:glycosyltransferase n=1 Tax=Thaumasiovibrio sp. DFM-14 TaxID=3384792 RepID=UPI0039A0772E
MKVIIYSQYWQKGGIEKLVQYMTENFPSDYSFSIITEDVPDPVNQYVLPKDTRVFFQSFKPFTPKNLTKLRTLIESIDPDVVIAMGSNRSLYKVSRACIGTPYPVIISEHNSDKEIARSLYNNVDFLNAIRNSADLNHVIFQSFAHAYPLEEKVRAISNPILESSYKSDVRDKEKNIIVNVARYHLEQKQQDVLVRAFSLVAKKYPNWELHLYGGDWFGGKNKVESLVKDLDLVSQVYVNDAIDNVEEVLASADIFAFPSAFEGFGLVVGEAMSVGVPVVAYSNCEGVNQLVRNKYNGLLVDSHLKDCDKFSKALDELMGNESKRLEYSNNAVEIVKDFSLNKFIFEWKNLIDEASSLKGKNKLLNLSEIEIHYMDLVVSGLLFDRAYANKSRNSIESKLRELIRKYKLQKLARYVYQKIK